MKANWKFPLIQPHLRHISLWLTTEILSRGDLRPLYPGKTYREYILLGTL